MRSADAAANILPKNVRKGKYTNFIAIKSFGLAICFSEQSLAITCLSSGDIGSLVCKSHNPWIEEESELAPPSDLSKVATGRIEHNIPLSNKS